MLIAALILSACGGGGENEAGESGFACIRDKTCTNQPAAPASRPGN